jgi:methionyl-tRNA formyltransferase
MNKSPISSALICILSTVNAPLLPRLIENLVTLGLLNICVVLDEKILGSKDQIIWRGRTEGAFDDGPSLYDFAQHNIQFYLVKSHNSDECLDLIKGLRPSVLLNGGTPRKLIAKLLNSAPQGVINVHPGILPKYRGASCVEWAIYNDEPIGNTAHFMTEGYDEGPIIKIEAYEFTPQDTYSSIRVKVYTESLRLMAETVKMVLDKHLTMLDAKPQGEGELFGPIPEEKMQLVMKKIATKSYSFMRA